MSNELPTGQEVWDGNRDSINIVMGGILGGFLGLTISRQGVQQGSYLDLFMLVTINAFAVIQILQAGNRYFHGPQWLAPIFMIGSCVTIWVGMTASRRLGIDQWIVATIFAAWIFLILVQIAAFEMANFLKKRNNV